MKKHKFILLTTLLIQPSILTAGNYFDIYGAHPRANGMANAVTSFVNDVSAIFYNPAGLGMPLRLENFYSLLEKNDNTDDKKNTQENQLDVLPEGFVNKLKYIGHSFVSPLKNYPKTRSKTPIHEISIGYNYAKPVNKVNFEGNDPQSPDLKKIKDNYITLGLSFNLNSFFNFDRYVRFGLLLGVPGSGNLALINDVNPTAHRFLKNGVSNERPNIYSGLGIEIWKNHLSIGIGLQIMLKGKGAILMKDVNITPDPTIPNSQAILELKPLMMPTYGIMFHYGRIMAGVSYKRETYAHVDPLGAQAQTTLLAIQFDFDLALLDLYSPRTMSVGISYKILDNFLFSIDIQREYWSLFKHSRTKEYVFSPIQEPLLRKIIRIPVVKFQDVTNILLGFEWDWKNPWKLPLTFRGGIGRKPTPVPAFYDQYNWMDNDRNIYTLGISYVYIPGRTNFINSRIMSPVVIDFSLENQQYKSRSVKKLEPTDKNPYYNYGGYAWAGHFSITIKL